MLLLLSLFLYLPGLSRYLYCVPLADSEILFKLSIMEQFVSFHIDLVIELYIKVPFKNNLKMF